MKTAITIFVFILTCMLPQYSHAQWINISGHITHALTGSAVENASVFEKHSEIGTISNKNGFFKLILRPGHMNLLFSENGFKSISEKMVLKKDTTLMVRLIPEDITKKNHSKDSEMQAGGPGNRNTGGIKPF